VPFLLKNTKLLNSFTIIVVVIWPVLFLFTCHTRTHSYFTYKLLSPSSLNSDEPFGSSYCCGQICVLCPATDMISPNNSFTSSLLTLSSLARASKRPNYYFDGVLTCNSPAFAVLFPVNNNTCSDRYLVRLLTLAYHNSV